MAEQIGRLFGPTWSAGVARSKRVALVTRLAPVAVATGVARRTHARHGTVRVEVALAAEPERKGREHGANVKIWAKF